MQLQTIPMEALAELLTLQLSRGTQAQLVVTGSSMLPMLRNNRDTVYLSPLSQPLKKGDLILYRRENGCYILHRIVSVSPTQLICCGDNQWMPEEIQSTQVLGVVSGFLRNGKRYETSHWLYRLYVWLWVEMFPVRRPYIALRRRLGRLLHTLKRRKQ